MVSMLIMPYAFMDMSLTRMIRVIFSILFSAELIRLIPGCFDEYLESRVQMYYHDKKDKANNSEKRKEDDLYFENSKKSENTRYQKRNHEKYCSDDDRTKIE
jgi:hypothetical protein